MKTNQKLIRLLEERSVSQSELARRIGYAPSTINSWINGRSRMYADQAFKVCEFFDVDANWFLDESRNYESFRQDKKEIQDDELANMFHRVYVGMDFAFYREIKRQRDPHFAKTLSDLREIIKEETGFYKFYELLVSHYGSDGIATIATEEIENFLHDGSSKKSNN